MNEDDVNYLPPIETMKKVTKALQSILGISDWDINVKYKNTRDMINEYSNVDSQTEGLANTNVQRNHSLICLNIDSPCDDEDGSWYDTLVHELMHVQQAEFRDIIEEFIDKDKMPNSLFETWKERYIDRLEKSFVNVYPLERFKSEHPDIFKDVKEQMPSAVND